MTRTRKMLIILAALLAVMAALSNRWTRAASINQNWAFAVILLIEIVLFVLIVRNARGTAS